MLSTLLLINAPPPAPHDNNYFKILGNSKKGAKSVNLDLIHTLQKFCFTCKKICQQEAISSTNKG